MIAATSLWLAAVGTVVTLPISGPAPSAPVVSDLAKVPGVERIELDGRALRLEVAEGREVRLRALEDALARHGSGTALDADAMAITANTIFELNAGQCFFCAEGPLAQTLGRMTFVERWSVVDYATKGRLRFRIEANGAPRLGAIGADEFEDVILTARYDGTREVQLYWPTGGIAWRSDERTARAEAARTKKPLMIFPTAGT